MTSLPSAGWHEVSVLPSKVDSLPTSLKLLLNLVQGKPIESHFDPGESIDVIG